MPFFLADYKYNMNIKQILAQINENKEKYRAQLIANRYVRRTAAPIPAEVLLFLRKHVKKVDSYLIIKQYNPEWYQYTFKDQNVVDFQSFFKKFIGPYFEIINKDGL